MNIAKLTFYALMDSSHWFDALTVICMYRGTHVKHPNKISFLSLKIVFVLANSADHGSSGSLLYAKVHTSIQRSKQANIRSKL